MLIQMIPFMNARAQGLYKLGRAARQDPVSFATKGAMLTIASLALWAFNQDNDDWKELEDWDKRAYYHFWVGKHHYRIPKPFEVGAIFSTMVEGAADTMTEDEDFLYFVDILKYVFSNAFAMNPIPQAIRPLAEQWANKSFFTGRPIESMVLQRLRPGERKEPWTSETTQLAGKLGISPKRAEALINGYLSTFGMFLLGMSDIMAQQFFEFPDKPAKRIDDYPLIGRFMRETPPRHSKYMTKFYEDFKEVDQLVATIKHYQRTGNFKKATELALKERKQVAKYKRMTKIRRRLSEINSRIKRTMIVKMDPEAKRKRLDSLIALRNGLVKQIFNQMV